MTPETSLIGVGVITAEGPVASSVGIDEKGEEMAIAGWYTDPTGHGDGRYWDGQRWSDQVNRNGVTVTSPIDPALADTPPAPGTEYVASTAADTPVAAAPAPAPAPKSSPIAPVLGAIAVVVAIVAIVIALTSGSDDDNDDEQPPSTTVESTEAPETTEAPESTEAPSE